MRAACEVCGKFPATTIFVTIFLPVLVRGKFLSLSQTKYREELSTVRGESEQKIIISLGGESIFPRAQQIEESVSSKRVCWNLD